ncbi:hypothetical protein ACIA5G_51220 [Amycolatopsis sp. NPDC051758]|uniref:hypothetical protein n=1 Tax=Amycolatopsis sp. NPDC051758 TaxID=3363935 RepID=UPI0037B0DBC3
MLLLPATYTAAEPRWSPGPGFVELATASKWGRRTPDGRLLAVVRSTDRETSHRVLISGALSATDLLGFGGITDKPHRLRRMAEPGTVSEQRLTETHPAMLYDRWTSAQTEAAEHRLALSDLPPERCDRLKLTRRPDGRYQLVLMVSAESPNFAAADVDDISRALTSIAKSYGAGMRLRLYRPDVDSAVTHPLYADTWNRLCPSADELGVGTFVDRLADLVQRASEAARPVS